MALMEFLKLALTVANLQVRHRFTADQDGSAVRAELTHIRLCFGA